MILFETSTSVFELLWDIALALFIIRIAFAYFILSFVSGCIIAYFRIAKLQPLYLLTEPQAELYTLPIWLLFIMLWARFTIVYYEVPRVVGFRLAIGLVALVYMLVAELVGGVFLYQKGYTPWIWETDYIAAGLGAMVLLLFGLMPWLSMGVERKTDELGETYHGHEKKPISDAVPVVSKVAVAPASQPTSKAENGKSANGKTANGKASKTNGRASKKID